MHFSTYTNTNSKDPERFEIKTNPPHQDFALVGLKVTLPQSSLCRELGCRPHIQMFKLKNTNTIFNL